MSRVPVPEQGWDSLAEVVDDVWLERTPRRPEVRSALEHEVRLMARVAPLLPLSVPVPVAVLDDRPWRVRHRLVPGDAGDPTTLTARDGRRVGRFLRTLHDVGFATYAPAGTAPEAGSAATLERLADAVLPRLPDDLDAPARALLDRSAYAAAAVPPVLLHGDLGPAHLLRTGCCVTGVIDWTDARLGDPAVDLAWALHGSPRPFAAAVSEAYRPSADELARSRDRHALGPWYEVAHGLDTGEAAYVASGTAGVVARLRRLAAG